MDLLKNLLPQSSIGWFSLQLHDVNNFSYVSLISTFFHLQKVVSLGGIARKPQPISTERCSTDLTDLIDIFTVDRPYEVRRNP